MLITLDQFSSVAEMLSSVCDRQATNRVILGVSTNQIHVRCVGYQKSMHRLIQPAYINEQMAIVRDSSKGPADITTELPYVYMSGGSALRLDGTPVSLKMFETVMAGNLANARGEHVLVLVMGNSVTKTELATVMRSVFTFSRIRAVHFVGMPRRSAGE